MREIKFRAQRLVTKEWMYGDLIKHSKIDAFSYIGIGTGYKIDNPEICTNIKIYPHTIGQYTGFNDKNGKEIYEGDIVFDEDGEYSKTCVIDWDNSVAKFFGKAVEDDDSYSMEEIDGEIIGNIYDNPELLK